MDRAQDPLATVIVENRADNWQDAHLGIGWPCSVMSSTAHDLSERLRWKPLVVFATLSVLASAAYAQSIATLKGRVTDASGAIVPGATITVRTEETGVQRS